jgi:uncharacterized protein
MDISWHGQRFTLLKERAAVWHEAGALVIADAHLGKAASFRSLGVPVPEGVTRADLARLDSALGATGVERLIVLGDFLHAAGGRQAATMEAIGQWRRSRPGLEILLVRGNHDRSAGDPPMDWDIRVFAGPTDAGIGALTLAHEPTQVPGRGALCGHLHPAVRMVDAASAAGARSWKGPGPSGARLACFWFGRDVAVWPAFGSFTGCAEIHPVPGDRVLAIGPEGVFEAPLARPTARDRRARTTPAM